ncbi:MAG: magnesium transporter [Treponema sp.]|jgi:magnesium transporter|nr:magnesium transporter [Treponema sp.]
MNIYIDNNPVQTSKSKQQKELLYIGRIENRKKILEQFSFLAESNIEYESTYFESHKSFNYFYFLVPSEDLTDPKSERIEIYLANKTMHLFYEGKPPIVTAWIKLLVNAGDKPESPKEAFFNFLNVLNIHHLARLEKIEDKITDLEDALVNEEKENYVDEIRVLRKQVLTLRRHYESMFALMEDLEENRNGLLCEGDLHLLHFQTQKVERLYHSTLNLRDYLTQVRESYQALLDIESNKVMKLFTVITSIFLPLSLLVGWYGMNLSMPEAAFRYTYPVVIAVSVGIVAGLIIYFKRNRWF